MGRIGGYTSVRSNLDENYLAEGIASFIACKKYDETITVINTSKGHDAAWRVQQLVNYRRTKRILIVDDEYDTNLTLKVVLEEWFQSRFIYRSSGSITKLLYMIWL